MITLNLSKTDDAYVVYDTKQLSICIDYILLNDIPIKIYVSPYLPINTDMGIEEINRMISKGFEIIQHTENIYELFPMPDFKTPGILLSDRKK